MADIDDHDPDQGEWLDSTRMKTLGDIFREAKAHWEAEDRAELEAIYARRKEKFLQMGGDTNEPNIIRGYN